MNNPESTTKQAGASEVSRTRTILWLGVGLMAYVFIQWMMPKVGVPS